MPAHYKIHKDDCKTLQKVLQAQGHAGTQGGEGEGTFIKRQHLLKMENSKKNDSEGGRGEGEVTIDTTS